MAKRRTWPKDGSPLMFDSLAEPIRKAIEFAYSIKRKNEDKRIPWNGPDIGYSERAACLSPKEALSKDNLAYSLEDQGYDALDTIIMLAVQLGMEQGRRAEHEKLASHIDLASISLDSVRSSLWSLQKRCCVKKAR